MGTHTQASFPSLLRAPYGRTWPTSHRLQYSHHLPPGTSSGPGDADEGSEVKSRRFDWLRRLWRHAPHVPSLRPPALRPIGSRPALSLPTSEVIGIIRSALEAADFLHPSHFAAATSSVSQLLLPPLRALGSKRELAACCRPPPVRSGRTGGRLRRQGEKFLRGKGVGTLRGCCGCGKEPAWGGPTRRAGARSWSLSEWGATAAGAAQSDRRWVPQGARSEGGGGEARWGTSGSVVPGEGGDMQRLALQESLQVGGRSSCSHDHDDTLRWGTSLRWKFSPWGGRCLRWARRWVWMALRERRRRASRQWQLGLVSQPDWGDGAWVCVWEERVASQGAFPGESSHHSHTRSVWGLWWSVCPEALLSPPPPTHMHTPPSFPAQVACSSLWWGGRALGSL